MSARHKAQAKRKAANAWRKAGSKPSKKHFTPAQLRAKRQKEALAKTPREKEAHKAKPTPPRKPRKKVQNPSKDKPTAKQKAQASRLKNKKLKVNTSGSSRASRLKALGLSEAQYKSLMKKK